MHAADTLVGNVKRFGALFEECLGNSAPPAWPGLGEGDMSGCEVLITNPSLCDPWTAYGGEQMLWFSPDVTTDLRASLGNYPPHSHCENSGC